MSATEPIIRAICVVRNEADIIRLCLTHATSFCHRIYVLDNASSDRTWEIVQEMSREFPQVVPVERRVGRFGRGFHAHVFNQTRAEYDEGDWVMILDADEFLERDPRPELASIAAAPQRFDSVQCLQAHFWVTDLEVEEAWFNRGDEEISGFDRLPSHYQISWAETRFFRYSPALTWPDFAEDGNTLHQTLPTGLRRRAPQRMLNRHYQFRSRRQTTRRLLERVAMMAEGKGRIPSHWRRMTQDTWEDYVLDHRRLRVVSPERPLVATRWDLLRIEMRRRARKWNRRRRRLSLTLPAMPFRPRPTGAARRSSAP